MKKPAIFYRRTVYVFFVCLFLVISPLVILYSQGYRYNVKKGLVQKTGILVARSQPRGATVLINGRSIDQQTPAKAEDILPGDYEVEITKDGYHSWHKKLTIWDNSTTFADDIILFKKNNPDIIINAPITAWLASPDHIYIGVIDQRATSTVNIINTATGVTTLAYTGPTGAKITLVSWSANSKKILITEELNGHNQSKVLNINELWQTTTDTIAKTYSHLSWDQNNDSIIYGRRNGQVFNYDLSTGREQSIATDNASSSFAVYDHQLFSQTENQLIWSDPQAKNPQLPRSTDCFACIIGNPFNNLITAHNQTDNQGLIINPVKNKIISADASGFDWLANGWLLGHSQWELWTYDRNQEDIEIITRLSTPITAAIWHPAGRHIIFATTDQLNIIELDNRDLRNVITLANVKDISGLTINPRNEIIYFAGTVGDQAGLFKLPLTD